MRVLNIKGVSSPLQQTLLEILSNFQLSQALYKFKGFLPIPPLIMIDDILTVSRCGFDSLLLNSLVMSKMDMKRLELGASKCFQLHIEKKIK